MKTNNHSILNALMFKTLAIAMSLSSDEYGRSYIEDFNDDPLFKIFCEENKYDLESTEKTSNSWGFKYNQELDSYKPIEEPEEVKHYVGFAIG